MHVFVSGRADIVRDGEEDLYLVDDMVLGFENVRGRRRGRRRGGSSMFRDNSGGSVRARAHS